MIQKIALYIRKYNLLSKHSKRIIVGLSGGVDSSVLLYVLHELGYFCYAAHCNFHLREKESNRDENQANRLASSMNIVFFKKDFDTQCVAMQRGISVEMAARYLRYEWFEYVKKTQNAQAIAVAHHRGDNIETLLLNLIRGTGLRGLTGMKPKNGEIIRPLLNVEKREILQFAQKNRIGYVTDSTNLKEEYKRNKVRHTLIPYLKTLNLSIEQALLYTIAHLKEVEKIYENHIKQAKSAVFDRDCGIITLSELRKYPSPESILFEILKEYGFNRKTIIAVAHGIGKLSGKEFHSPNYVIIKDRDRFLLIPRQRKNQRKKYEINKGDREIMTPLFIQIDHKEVDDKFQIIRNNNMAYLDEDKLQFPLQLRNWEKGDKFVPFGMCNFQKLSDFFNKNRFSKLKKEKTWLLCCKNDILWIVGKRIDNRYKISSTTTKALILTTV